MKMDLGNYEIKLDGNWSLEDLYLMSYTYIQVYSFLYSFYSEIEDYYNENDRLVITYSAHPWKGGFSAVNFYNNLKYIVPPKHRPKIKLIKYGSPGYIELTLIVGVAFNIKKIISCFCACANMLNDLYQNIYKGMHERKLMKIEAKRKNLILSKEQLYFVSESADQLSKLLGFENLNEINKLTQNPLATLKILLSFYRKIKKLADFTQKKKAKF